MKKNKEKIWYCDKYGKEVCKYVIMKQIPKSAGDLHRELPWDAYGATISEEFVLTKQQIEWLIMLLEASKDLIDCDKLREGLKSVVWNGEVRK